MSTALGLLAPLTSDGYGRREESQARQAVLDGVSTLWIRDLPCVPEGDADAGQRQDPFAYIAAMASRTPGATYGLAVAIAGVRHPLILARAAVSAQYYTGNRFILGIGTGGKRPMSEALGVWGRGVEQFVSEWGQVREALKGRPGDGLTFDLPDGYLPPPMWLATTRPEFWEPLAGQVDGWMTGFLSPAQLEETYGYIARTNGPTSSAMRLSVHLPHPDDAPDEPVKEGRFLVCKAEYLIKLMAEYSNLGLDQIIVLARNDLDANAWRRVVDCWESR
jgi:alkanesulfonate monooxygenase SsuD/methylene tetrahydromethanopterin reductase-like flavin-dependent oxidoreductase (luciferase family)